MNFLNQIREIENQHRAWQGGRTQFEFSQRIAMMAQMIENMVPSYEESSEVYKGLNQLSQLINSKIKISGPRPHPETPAPEIVESKELVNHNNNQIVNNNSSRAKIQSGVKLVFESIHNVAKPVPAFKKQLSDSFLVEAKEEPVQLKLEPVAAESIEILSNPSHEDHQQVQIHSLRQKSKKSRLIKKGTPRMIMKETSLRLDKITERAPDEEQNELSLLKAELEEVKGKLEWISERERANMQSISRYIHELAGAEPSEVSLDTKSILESIQKAIIKLNQPIEVSVRARALRGSDRSERSCMDYLPLINFICLAVLLALVILLISKTSGC